VTNRFSLAGVFAAVALSASLVAVACGGDDDSTSSVQVKTPAAGSSVAAQADHAAEIDQNNLEFIPTKVTIKVGQSVLIKNSESAIHTANINGEKWSGNMKKGDSKLWTANRAGEYKVTCDYHPAMKATIVVAP
jgi:plastocyanin